jgi:protein-tyrosine phosphatase
MMHPDATADTVLFLCTGNYYRSRLAELYFNATAAARGLRWRADSRGLRLNPANPGPISRQTVHWLHMHGILVPEPTRCPVQVVEADLLSAALVVALKEAEHRPLLERHFPAWADRVEYWHVHDQDCATAEEALPVLAARIEALVDRLSAATANSVSS